MLLPRLRAARDGAGPHGWDEGRRGCEPGPAAVARALLTWLSSGTPTGDKLSGGHRALEEEPLSPVEETSICGDTAPA